MHWAVAIPFMVCYATALILVVVYNPDPSRPFRQIVSWAHRISGLCLLVLPAYQLVTHWRDARTHLHNVRQAWSWSWNDVRWLCLVAPASLTRKVTLPWQGKFNAGEKVNFMVLTATYPVYLCTGLLIWFDTSPYLSWLVHFSLAAAATPLLLGHLFMAIVNPDTRPGLRGMITGFVDREWARHHYRRWYAENFEAVKAVIRRVPSWRPGRATPPPAFAAGRHVPRATASRSRFGTPGSPSRNA